MDECVDYGIVIGSKPSESEKQDCNKHKEENLSDQLFDKIDIFDDI